MSTVQDTDLLLVNRGGIDYKVPVVDLKKYIHRPPPWIGRTDVIWHVKNANGTVNLSGMPCQAWTVDGKSLGTITSFDVGDELIFATDVWRSDHFSGNNLVDWDFGEYTDTSRLKSMDHLFSNCGSFNGTLGGNWDTSNVVNMSYAFEKASAFNQDIGGWDTSGVTSMKFVFNDALSFNQDISSWNTSKVTDMRSMFSDTGAFNSDIGGWDTSNVTNMNAMFYSTHAFNQDIGGWDVANVSDMDAMFKSSFVFNQDLSGWCVEYFIYPPSQFDIDAVSWGSARPKWGQPCDP